MRVLVFSPHPDDAEWGAGGLLSAASAATVALVAETTHERVLEAFSGAKTLGAEVDYGGAFGGPDGSVSVSQPVIDWAEALRWSLRWTHVALPPLTDTHQDHRAVNQIVRSAFRRSHATLLEYETPSAHDWTPNIWLPLTEADVIRKADALQEHRSQSKQHYMDPNLVTARARVAGTAIGVEFAEAFRLIRGVL